MAEAESELYPEAQDIPVIKRRGYKRMFKLAAAAVLTLAMLIPGLIIAFSQNKEEGATPKTGAVVSNAESRTDVLMIPGYTSDNPDTNEGSPESASLTDDINGPDGISSQPQDDPSQQNPDGSPKQSETYGPSNQQDDAGSPDNPPQTNPPQNNPSQTNPPQNNPTQGKRVFISASVPEKNMTSVPNIGLESVFMSTYGKYMGEEYTSPALLEKMEKHRGQDVWFRVLLGMPITKADIAAHRQVPYRYPVDFSEYIAYLTKERLDFAEETGAENITPVAGYYLRFSNYYMELTGEMLNRLIEKGGYVIYLAPPVRKEGYSEKISDYLTERLSEMKDNETVHIMAITNADRSYWGAYKRLFFDSEKLSAFDTAHKKRCASYLETTIFKYGTDSAKMAAVKGDLIRFEKRAEEMYNREEEILKIWNALQPIDWHYVYHGNTGYGTPIYTAEDQAKVDAFIKEEAALRKEWDSMRSTFRQCFYDYIDAIIQRNNIADKRIDTSVLENYPADIQLGFTEGWGGYKQWIRINQIHGYTWSYNRYDCFTNVKFEANLTKAEVLRLAEDGDIFEIDLDSTAYQRYPYEYVITNEGGFSS